MKTIEKCYKCDGKGFQQVMNGSDDVDLEPCQACAPEYRDDEEEYQERRAYNLEWLSDMGLTEGDVMEDEVGEYVYLDEEDGLKKTYLPYESEIALTF